MRVDEDRAVLARVCSPFAAVLTSVCLFAAPVAFAQDADEEQAAASTEQRVAEEIVVTGSRLKRDTFSSVAPLQVITGQVSREIGSIDPSTILQQAPSAGGQQTDITYQGFVTPNGPGSSTIDLRGLGDSRTLVLINGRRAAPVGVEGAPFALDLNMVPSSLVQRYEILLDGASSIYGSDAVSGVANIILRKDFDGLELETYTTLPEYEGGESVTLSASWGKTYDRGVFGVAVDATRIEAIDRSDRPWTEGCESEYFEDENGNILREYLGYENDYGMKRSDCTVGFGTQRVFDNDAGIFGSLYYTPGTTNTTIPNLSEATLFDAALDSNGDGIPDVDFTDYFLTEAAGVEHLIPEIDRISAMAYGEYTFAGEANITPYFEVLYNKRETFARSNPAGLLDGDGFDVPGSNPFNPCNPAGLNGVDCGEAWDSVLTDPAYIAAFGRRYEALCAANNIPLAGCTPVPFGIGPIGPTGPITLEPQVSVNGDRDTVNTEVDQIRYVAGVRGDIPMLNAGSLDNWSFDFAVVHSDASGESLRTGINKNLLRYSYNTTVVDPVTGAITCGNGTDGCVPVNLFAPSLYATKSGNDFATQAERDYLFADRTFVTDYTQTLYSLVFTGDLFALPAGDLAVAVGYDYRDDEIKSIPNDVARDGLLAGFFRDLGAVGSKSTKEWFAEVEAPLLANVPGFEELTLNVATRHTDDEFYGGAYTYSAKLSWTPVESLTLKGTVGTSYRAPNLRENFLQGTSGFLAYNDPCVPPESSITADPGNPNGFSYDATGDNRTPAQLANCIGDGIDPTTFRVTNSAQVLDRYSVEVLRGVGTTDLREEKSDSWTAGFAWKQPMFESFDLTLGATYYDISLRDEITQLGGQFSIDNCYADPQGDSPFCRNLTRDPVSQDFTQIDQQFINQDQLKTRGVDINVAFDWPTEVFGKAVDFGADIVMNRKLEFVDIFNDPESGVSSIDSDLGEFGLSEWEGTGIFRADVGDYRLTWATRYVGSVSADPFYIEQYPFDNYNNNTDYGACVGPAAGGVNCRPILWADNYFRHDASFYFYGDVWTFGVGARNILNERPPLVSGITNGQAFTQAFNTPLGVYDLNGRSYFFNVRATFQ